MVDIYDANTGFRPNLLTTEERTQKIHTKDASLPTSANQKYNKYEQRQNDFSPFILSCFNSLKIV